MKRKRLDFDTWWEHNNTVFPRYYQLRVDIEGFNGLVGVLYLVDEKSHHWDLPIAGKVMVIGKGMTWLQLVPDDGERVMSVKYLPDGSVSIWYVDIIDGIEYDADGVVIFTDKYLDVVFTPQGDVIIDDRDELDEAFRLGELSKEQYDSALNECNLIIDKYCFDIKQTEVFCNKILSHVNDRIKNGEK
ncbi:MAG: DUF402 domain-containing protein [Defluviitaleaceae bacterium]|nr:DUF402 domain-containing protein [Defluviitaleaceae bacterium]